MMLKPIAWSAIDPQFGSALSASPARLAFDQAMAHSLKWAVGLRPPP